MRGKKTTKTKHPRERAGKVSRAPGRLRLSALWAAPLLTDLFVTALAGAYRPALRPARARSAKDGAAQARNRNSIYWL